MATGEKLALKGMLEHLTDVYYRENGSDVYYHALEEQRREVFFAFPGFTIVLCEVHDREYAPAMTHVLAPEPATTTHTLGWHDTWTAQLSLDDGRTELWHVASLEVRQDDGTWLAGTVEAGGPAHQSYMLTTSTGEQRVLTSGDRVRKIVFRSPIS